MNVPTNILKTITKNNSFLAHAHLSPDPDSLGSALALKLGLESIGKVVHLYCEDEIPTNTTFLPGIDTISQSPMADILNSIQFDVYLALDTAKWPLATHHEPIPEIKKPIINIDHHPDNNLRTKLSWVNPESSSTTELIFALFSELKIDITPEIATCLLYGIHGDTGIFQNYNTTVQTLDTAAKLIQLKGDYQASVTSLVRSLDPEQLKIYGLMLNNLRISPDNKFAWFTLNHDEWSKFNPKTNIKGFSNHYAGRIEGTLFGATLTEKEAGITKGSIRSRFPEVDVAQIARLIGGGGHKNAAGFRIEKPLKEAEQDFLNAVEYIQKQDKI